MTRKKRDTNQAKNRIVCASPNLFAYKIYQEVNKVQGKGWLSKYLSEKLIQDYGTGSIAEKVLKEMIAEKNIEIDELRNNQNKIIDNYRKIKEETK